MSKPISIADLLERKDQLKNKKNQTKTLYIESLDSHIVIQKPSRALVNEALSMDGDKADEHIVYNCVIKPNLKSADLQKGFGCVEPTDIVDMLFEAGEVTAISGHSLQLAGYGNGLKAVDKEIKN